MKNKIFRRKNNMNFYCRQFKLTAIGALLLTATFPALADDPDLLVCNSRGYILKTKTDAAAVGATSYKWYEGETLQTGETGESLTVSAGKTPGVYQYARFAINDDCEVSSNTFTVQVLATPSAPTISVTDVCKDAGDLVFSIAPATGTTYTWTHVSGATGSASGDDHSTYTVSGASTGTTVVKASASLTYNIGALSPKICVSALTAEKTAKVNPLPTVIQTGDDTFCGSTAITTLTVYAQVNGETSGIDIEWYANSDGSGALSNNSTTYTPTLTAGTTGSTYYVGATVTATGCESASLATVTGTLGLTEGAIDGNELP